MLTIRSAKAMQRKAVEWKRAGTLTAFVPTMGYLHEGHLALMREARKRVGIKGNVVVSIYVNPTQFAPSEDLSRYPRDFARDRKLCREAGVDLIFAPNDDEMYPGKKTLLYSTYVVEESLSRTMEGASRPDHFRGVTTVVAKLFNIVLPDLAVFGAKDFQQAAIIKRMTADLNFPVKIIIHPTMRENDGLAMSSRNKYLTGDLRSQATVLWRAIGFARASVASGKQQPLNAQKLKKDLLKLIHEQPAARVDYIECFDPTTLVATNRVTAGTHLALAVFIGKTRLIDNATL